MEGYLSVQPIRLAPNVKVKLVLLRGLLKGGAQAWFSEWRRGVTRGERPETWEVLKNDIEARNLHPFEGSRAYYLIRNLEYEGDINNYLTKFDLLNAYAEIRGYAYQETILKALPRYITNRIFMQEITSNDSIFRSQVFNDGVDEATWNDRMKINPTSQNTHQKPVGK